MDCQTAEFLIEAFHDDELEVVQVAGLIGHLESCAPCRQRHESVRALRELCRRERPADRCPDELKRRLVSCLPTRQVRWPRVAIRSVTVVLLATGLGFVLGRRIPRKNGDTISESVRSALLAARSPVPRQVVGDVVCLRCTLRKIFPGTPLAGENHPPLLRTSDGLFFLLIDHAGSRIPSSEVLGSECERHLTAR